MDNVELSVVVPVYNEIESLQELHRRVKAVMESLTSSWELVLVDDGCSDGSTERMKEIAAEDPHVRPVIFARNFGHQIAITAGLDYARGDAVVIMDADLQDPPEVIADLVEKWREGYEVVYAVRAEREGESWFKLATASLFYRLINRITNVDIPLDTGDFRLLDRSAAEVLRSMGERHRFPRGMAAWIGFRQIGVPYKRAARYAGETKYPLRKMIRLAMNAITGFSDFPLKLASYLGASLTGLGALLLLVVLLSRAINGAWMSGTATLITATVFIGGVQLLSVGILGEYIGRIYDEVKDRPLYIVREAPTGADVNLHTKRS